MLDAFSNGKMNKYNRVRQIGEGAFGKAVLVKRKDTSKQFVIKEINITKMSPKEREEARKEVAVLAQLKHPNIVAYIESFEERGSLYIVMNFCSGGDLYSKINDRRGQLFSEDMILNWFVQLCLAVKHIHDRKILHRDIKSQNIFLTHSGTVQLGDFGIAKVLNTTAQLAHTCIGTPYYLSPEIVENMPYNNKSDIWSMGCVLYELTTLKHAFEAGNMKNLVLKIIRGSYPPISPQFSYDLRGLIAQLFKRNPRDRPTVNNILRKNFIMQRVRKLLSSEDLENEFSHTVMHGHKIAKALPPAPKPSADPAKKVGPTPRPGSANKRYDPAAIYGAPVNSTKNRLSSDQKKRPSTPGRQLPVPGQVDWEKKKKERQELEQKRRAEMRKREQEMNERRHKDLVERQKMARINKAREEGWKNLIDPHGVDENRTPTPSNNNRPKSPRPLPVPRGNNDNRERGNYEAYNEFLDKLYQEKMPPPPAQAPPARNPNVDVLYMAAPRPVPAGPQAQRQAVAQQQFNMGPLGIPAAVDQAGRDRQLGAQAAQRARVVEDYIQRQQQAALNKKRAQHDLYGIHRPSSADRRTPVPAPRRGASPGPGRGDGGAGGRGGGGGGGRGGWAGGGGGGGGMIGRNREEQEYLEKLRQIRMQNMKDRRALHGRNVAEKAEHGQNSEDAEERKKKVEALKAQAEQWAEMKKNELERQRQGMVPSKSPAPVPSPVPGVPITGALQAIGAAEKAQQQPILKDGNKPAAVPLTNAMQAIGGNTPTPAQPERPKSALQKQKENILKKVNDRNPSRSKWGAPASPVVPAANEESERGKWGIPASPTVNLAVRQEEEDQGVETSRSQWGDGKDLHLSKVPLELTASQMERTGASDQVVKMAADGASSNTEEGATAGRGRWGRRSDIVKALDKMPICQDTVTLSDSQASTPTPATPPVGVGATITIAQPPPAQGATITISSADAATAAAAAKQQMKTNRPLPLPPERSGTIVISRESTDKLPYDIPQVSPCAQEGELPSSLHFQIPPNVDQTALGSSAKVSNSQAPVGEGELPSSIRFVDHNQDVSTPRQVTNELASYKPAQNPMANEIEVVRDKRLDTLVEVSESQSLSDSQQQSVQEQFKVYLNFKRSQREKKSENMAELSSAISESSPHTSEGKNVPVIDAIDSKTKLTPERKKLLSSQKVDMWSTKSDDDRDGAKSVQMNLTSGNFDLKNIEMLRTCSEPDLTYLFSTLLKAEEVGDNDKPGSKTPSTLRRHRSLDMTAVNEDVNENDDNGDDDEFAEEDLDIYEDDDDENNDEDNDADEKDDEDLKSIQETMRSILDEDEEDGEDNTKTKVSIPGGDDTTDGEKKPSTVKCAPRKINKEEESDPADDTNDDGGDGDEQADDGDDEDDGNNEDDEDEKDREKLELAAALELENEGDSDDETTFGDDDDDDEACQTKDYDRFGRLEAMRQELEKELGLEKLVEVYQTIQRMQEDDEGNIEDGAKVAIELLGPSKQHLFPKVFQLVMSDTAFNED